MAKKNLGTFLNDDDNPVMDFLNNAEAAGGFDEIESEVRRKAKEMNIENFVQIPELRDIFPRDKNLMEYITSDMKKNGYDFTEPLVFWKYNGENVIVDGNTRFECALAAGLKKVVAGEHDFESLEQAVEYAKHRQVRRSLTQQQIYQIANIEFEHERGEGRDVEIKAKMTGLSPSTIQHAKTIEKKGSEEIKAAVKSGDLSINEAYKKVNPPKKKKEKDPFEDETEEVSEALEDTSGNPKGLTVWDHSDGIERPDVKPYDSDDSMTKRIAEERKASYEEGRNDGLKEGCELAEKLFYFAIGEMRKGRTPDEILSDERVSDFSPSVITKFVLPEEDENGGI